MNMNTKKASVPTATVARLPIARPDSVVESNCPPNTVARLPVERKRSDIESNCPPNAVDWSAKMDKFISGVKNLLGHQNTKIIGSLLLGAGVSFAVAVALTLTNGSCLIAIGISLLGFLIWSVSTSVSACERANLNYTTSDIAKHVGKSLITFLLAGLPGPMYDEEIGMPDQKYNCIGFREM